MLFKNNGNTFQSVSIKIVRGLSVGCLIAMALTLGSCKTEAEKEHEKSISDKIGNQFNETYSQIKSLDANKLSKHAQDLGSLTAEQLQMLTQIEYRVMEISVDDGMGLLQSNLQALGKERWDCNVTEDPAGRKWRLICKKYPLNYLGALKGVFGF